MKSKLMNEGLEPLQAPSLKEVFVSKFEALILSGEFSAGQRLPSERDLAARLGVSRPVVHSGLAELATRGMVTMRPRVGTVVNDYRTSGSLSLLSSLMNFHGGAIEPALLGGLLDMRRLVEVETARLAAIHRSEEDLTQLVDLLAKARSLSPQQTANLVEADFSFHHRIALASGNVVYPMLLRSFEPAYRGIASEFFSIPGILAEVHQLQEKLVSAIDQKDSGRACSAMEALIAHGAEVLENHFNQSKRSH